MARSFSFANSFSWRPSLRFAFIYASKVYGIVPVHPAGEEIAWSGVMSYDDRYPGKLYVTNRRLFFEQERGKFKKKAYITVETPLNDVTDVSLEKGPWNWNVLVIATKDKNHRFMFREKHPEVLMGRISEILTKRDSL